MGVRRGAEVLAVAVLGLAACGRPDGSPSTLPSVRDSAGVRIAENPADPPAVWRIGPAPQIEIGGSEAEDQILFRVAGALRLSDGRIVVADGSNRLRYYRPDGSLDRVAGRTGEGPGEFRRISWIGLLPGDSAIVFDLAQWRLSIFDPAGEFVRSFRAGAGDTVRFVQVAGRFGDGSFLGQGPVNTGGRIPQGLERHDIPLYRLGPDGSVLDALGEFPGNELYFEPVAGGGFSFYRPFFPRSASFVASGTYLYVGTGDLYEIRQLDLRGKLLRLIRRLREPVQVTEQDIRREREERLATESGAARQAVARALDAMPKPAVFPAYGLIRAGEDGGIWVQDYPARPAAEIAWAVFDSTGALRAEVKLPWRFDPQDIGRDFVLGVWRDEDGVEYVRLYRLFRP
ncbi:MAG: hypothetical protein KatS3mg081_0764 [Gemmatimonadales bacterium]|nr:MAG: hypothetical protein KatS3mg081_0764 [Gemmatimonadales bacterium]